MRPLEIGYRTVTPDDPPPFYPAEAMSEHGLTAEEYQGIGCYAIELETPTLEDFNTRWHRVYDIDPPPDLSAAIGDGRGVVYVGSASNLLNRLVDHVQRDVRKVNLLAVMPPARLAAVWPGRDRDRERDTAMRYSQAHPGVVCWCDGEVY